DDFHEVQDADEKTKNKFNGLISKIRLDEDALGKNGEQHVGDPEESVIPDDVFVKFLEMVMPSSPNNPFKASRVRNYLIVNLLVLSGIRRGALAKLKISDCLFHG
ncbi:site-specific integrase, partial [Pseudomonas aeruginosa]|nr:site-specific integrase [Pseudomonas aeruginosa]